VLEKEKKHYVTVFMVGEMEAQSKEPALMEPDKCEGWLWVEWEEMRSWAVAELRENGVRMENNSLNSICPSNLASNKLFLPLLSLVQDRPEVVPRRA